MPFKRNQSTKQSTHGTSQNPAKKSLIRTGGAVVVALYGINVLGEPVVENLTGQTVMKKQ